jgi:hypothetical protein
MTPARNSLLTLFSLACLFVSAPRAVAQPFAFSPFAGTVSAGAEDGIAGDARFSGIADIAVDSAGNLYVAETVSHTVRKITPHGEVTTLAGLAGVPGSADGVGGFARFNSPSGIAVDTTGNVYVADTFNQTIRKISPGGVVTTLAGLAGAPGSVDGVGSDARFTSPVGVAVDSEGTVYTAEPSRLRSMASLGLVVTIRSSPSYNYGKPEFGGLATDGAGNLYYSDYSLDYMHAYFTSSFYLWRRSKTGHEDLLLAFGTSFGFPGYLFPPFFTKIAVDRAGNVYIQPDGFRIEAGAHISQAGPGFSKVSLGGNVGIAIDAFDNIYTSSSTAIQRSRSTSPMPIRGSSDQSQETTAPALDSLLAGQDAATIDSDHGPLGMPRQLDATPGTATAWKWKLIRRPSGSNAVLSSDSIRNPTFTPDRADLFVFRLTASDPTGAVVNVSTVSLAGEGPTCTPPSAVVSVLAGSSNAVSCESGVLRADLTGTPPWRLTWSDGFVQDFITQSPVFRTGSVYETSRAFTVTEMRDANCSATGLGSGTIYGRPAAPPISYPETVNEFQKDLVATVPDHPGSTYTWTIANGTIQSGQGTSRLVFTSGARAAPNVGVALTVVETTSAGCSSPVSAASVPFCGRTPIILAPDTAFENEPDLVATLPESAPGSTIVWTIQNGTIRTGQGTSKILFRAGDRAHGDGVTLAVDVVAANGCTFPTGGPRTVPFSTTPPVLTLSNVETAVTWRSQYSGETGIGFPRTVPDGHGHTAGYFHFQGPQAPSVFVTIIPDQTGAGALYFYGGATDYEYTIRFKDLRTSKVVQFTNPAGNIGGGGYNVALGQHFGRRQAQESEVISPTAIDNSEVLMASGQVSVRMAWRSQYSGETGFGTVFAPGKTTPWPYPFVIYALESYGWPAAFVTVLDYGSGPFVVFHGGLTDFEYTVTVTVVRTGQTVTFTKPAGSYQGGADTTLLR